MNGEHQARIIAFDDDGLAHAAALLSGGDVVAVPTETVYGLAADASNRAALAKVFAAKQRPHFDPLILHLPQALGDVDALAAANIIDLSQVPLPTRALISDLIGRFWPGPLTLVLPKGAAVPSLATSGLPTVAVRMPAHKRLQALLARLQRPLAAPSANRFGHVSPTTAAHVATDLGADIALILDDGPTRIGIESTIVGMSSRGGFQLLREGALAKAEIEVVVGRLDNATGAPESDTPVLGGANLTRESSIATASAEQHVVAPGMLARHYAPHTPLLLYDARDPDGVTRLAQQIAEACGGTRSAQLALLRMTPSCVSKDQLDEALKRQYLGASTVGIASRLVTERLLAPDGSSQTAAQWLFGSLRGLEQSPIAAIVACVPQCDDGLWPAVSDRLRRAAVQKRS